MKSDQTDMDSQGRWKISPGLKTHGRVNLGDFERNHERREKRTCKVSVSVSESTEGSMATIFCIENVNYIKID
jgi:hypothetical protein